MGVKPNILLVILDAVRPDHLSCYGYRRKTSPNVDNLAEESILFENAISPAGWTLPAHASLFTGLFPSQHGLQHGSLYLNQQFPTLAEVLHSSGYKTIGISNNPWVSHATGLDRGFEIFQEVYYKKEHLLEGLRFALQRLLAIIGNTDDDGAHCTNHLALTHLSQQEEGQPFFVFINYLESHLPYKVPRPYATLFGKPPQGGINQDWRRYVSGKVMMGEDDFESLQSLYDGAIAYLDAKIDELLSFLRQREILDETLVIITSDHGDNFGDHGLMGHELGLYDSLLRIPLIIRYPSLFPAGRRVTQQVQLLDLFTTILEILGQKGIEAEGYSLLPEGLKAKPRRFTVAEQSRPSLEVFKKRFPEFDPLPYDRALRAIRTEGYKYIWASDGRDELYNIRADPEEKENLISTQPEKAQELRQMLEGWLRGFPPYEAEEEAMELDEITRERLRGLGYIP